MLLAVIALIWLIVLAFLVGLCQRGRRVGADPHCPGCEFNLVGIAPVSVDEDFEVPSPGSVYRLEYAAEAVICPECGEAFAHPGGLRTGQRLPRTRLKSLVAVLVLFPVVSVLLIGYRSGWSFNVYRAMPFGVLSSFVLGQGPWAPIEAEKELQRRIDSGNVSKRQLALLTQRSIDELDRMFHGERGELPGNGLYEQMVGIAASNGSLDQETQRHVFRLSFGVQAARELSVLEGASLPIYAAQRNSMFLRPGCPPELNRQHGLHQWFPFRISGIKIDNIPLPASVPSTDRVEEGWNSVPSFTMDPGVDLPRSGLSPGHHSIEWTITIGPFNESKYLTEEEVLASGFPTEAWEVVAVTSLTVVARADTLPPRPMEWSTDHVPLSRDADSLVLEPDFLTGIGIEPGDVVPHEILLVSGEDEFRLAYGLSYRNRANQEGIQLGQFIPLYKGGSDFVNAHPDARVVMRATRDAADRAMVADTPENMPRLRVPLYELDLKFDGRRLTPIGPGRPNPLAVELGMIEPDANPSDTKGP